VQWIGLVAAIGLLATSCASARSRQDVVTTLSPVGSSRCSRPRAKSASAQWSARRGQHSRPEILRAPRDRFQRLLGGYLELVTTENHLSRHKCLASTNNPTAYILEMFGSVVGLGSEFFLRPTASPALPRFGAFKQCGSLRRRHNGAETIHRRYFLQHHE
jgi:hypothetical protein